MDYVYRMTWAEFQLRLIGFNKSQVRNEYKLRRLAWITYIAPHQDPKKLRTLKEHTWWKIGKDRAKKVSSNVRELFLQRAKEYYNRN